MNKTYDLNFLLFGYQRNHRKCHKFIFSNSKCSDSHSNNIDSSSKILHLSLDNVQSINTQQTTNLIRVKFSVFLINVLIVLNGICLINHLSPLFFFFWLNKLNQFSIFFPLMRVFNRETGERD